MSKPRRSGQTGRLCSPANAERPLADGQKRSRVSILSNKASSVSSWWLHELRRTLATGLQRLGVRLEVTEAVLNHLSGSRAGIVGIYQRHDWAAEKRSAPDAWCTLSPRHKGRVLKPLWAALPEGVLEVAIVTNGRVH
jgi:hypothetical protein